ncbi:MAG: hypothetical protein C0515_04600 [Novosphingobium sp.]|nr:hypothetical protein [Novosphingobium sp.]MBX9643504.1 rhodanese-like domain-containing protein [Novosphingobium sp.]
MRAIRLALVIGLALATPALAIDTADDNVSAATVPGRVESIAPAELAMRNARGEVLLIDVRSAEEFAAGHIAGAVNLPLESVSRESLPQAPGREIVLYCRSGKRSNIAATRLVEAGMPVVRQLEGGILSWEAAGLPTTKP